MKKVIVGDKVLTAARETALRKAYLPQSIKKSFNVTIKSGKVVLTKKSS